MPEHTSTRDRILHAYEELLINEGPRGATMDAVIALAGVSKGGLLYHFKNKEAMASALIARLEELAAVDLKAMSEDPEGPSRYLVRESVYEDSPLDRALIGVARLAQASDQEASAVLERIHCTWMELILQEVGHPAIARAIVLLGDGLYYNEGLPGGWPREKSTSTAESVAELLEVVEVLKAHAASVPQPQ